MNDKRWPCRGCNEHVLNYDESQAGKRCPACLRSVEYVHIRFT